MTCARFKNMALIALFLSVFSSLAACSNTVDGAGQDIENAGEEIQKAAD